MPQSRREMHRKAAGQNHLLRPSATGRSLLRHLKETMPSIMRTARVVLFTVRSKAGYTKDTSRATPVQATVTSHVGSGPLPGLRFCPPACARVIISKRELGHAVLRPECSSRPPCPSESCLLQFPPPLLPSPGLDPLQPQ